MKGSQHPVASLFLPGHTGVWEGFPSAAAPLQSLLPGHPEVEFGFI